MRYKDFVSDLRQMDREALEAYIYEQEAPLIERLEVLARQHPHAVRAEKIEIRDERIALSDLRQMWLKLHRPETAGRDQVIHGGEPVRG